VSRIDVILEEDLALGPFLGSVITVKVVLLRLTGTIWAQFPLPETFCIFNSEKKVLKPIGEFQLIFQKLVPSVPASLSNPL
jgi:hypothetical protein